MDLYTWYLAMGYKGIEKLYLGFEEDNKKILIELLNSGRYASAKAPETTEFQQIAILILFKTFMPMIVAFVIAIYLGGYMPTIIAGLSLISFSMQINKQAKYYGKRLYEEHIKEKEELYKKKKASNLYLKCI